MVANERLELSALEHMIVCPNGNNRAAMIVEDNDVAVCNMLHNKRFMAGTTVVFVCARICNRAPCPPHHHRCSIPSEGDTVPPMTSYLNLN